MYDHFVKENCQSVAKWFEIAYYFYLRNYSHREKKLPYVTFKLIKFNNSKFTVSAFPLFVKDSLVNNRDSSSKLAQLKPSFIYSFFFFFFFFFFLEPSKTGLTEVAASEVS